ncbi:MAG: DUF4398 domain-containing protein [Gammaproteobacteria bacterium]
MKKLKNRLFSVFGSALLLTGCAGTLPPHEEISRSSYAIKQAEEDGALDMAPLELRKAQKSLAKAQAAMQEEEYEVALHHAETAEIEAALAKAKTESAKAKKSAEEIQESIKTLKKELGRYQVGIQ